MKNLDAGSYALAVSGGDGGGDLKKLFQGACFTAAVDRGAQLLWAEDLLPDLLVGDFDSCPSFLVEVFKDRGVEVLTLPAEKDKTDTEVALDVILERGHKRVLVYAALGGKREEHAAANLFLVEHFYNKGLDVTLISNSTCVFGIGPGERSFIAEKGDWVSLIPVTSKVSGVTTQGLKYELKDAVLTRGSTYSVSNEMTCERASVKIREGFLLMFLTH